MPESNGLGHVLNPIAAARGLPNAHYVSDEAFRAERERILFANWAGIGFAAGVAPGEAVPVDFAGQPLLLVRSRAGELRVLQNTCRHRGMILVEERKRVGDLIRCPYHSWCYSAAGELVSTPHVGGPGVDEHEAIRRGELGLAEIRSHVWRDVVFVNVDGRAPPFEEYAADAIARWSEFEGRELHGGGPENRFLLDVKCNWKLAVENYCESYHLPWVHPGLNSYSRLEDHYDIERAGAFAGQGSRVYNPAMAEDGRRFPDFEGLSGQWDAGAEYLALFPNVLLGVHRDHAFAIVLEPRGTGRTLEHVALYYATPEAAEGPEWKDMRAANAKMWKEVFEEDVFVVEGMQRGRSDAHFDGGRFSPAMDGPTHCFHHWVAGRLVDGAGAAA